MLEHFGLRGEFLMSEDKKFVTREEVLERELRLNKEMMEFYEKNSAKIEIVNDKVDDLKEMVLPLVESSKATASNTERIASSLDTFINKQSETNTDLYGEISKHKEVLAERKGYMDIQKHSNKDRLEEKKMKNSTKGAIIAGVVGIITTLITVAPALAQVFFN